MEVVCRHCTAKINIPDEKIPPNQVIRLACPKCKNKIILDTGRLREKRPDSLESGGQKAADAGYGYEDYGGDEGLDFFEEGIRPALILESFPENFEILREAVEGLGYRAVHSTNTRDAIGKMRFYQFDLILLSDGFDNQGFENNPILSFLNHASISVRRKIFLVLLSERFRTLDNMMAFALSANAVVDTEDMDKLPMILKKAISDHEKFYKVYVDTLSEVGKA